MRGRPQIVGSSCVVSTVLPALLLLLLLSVRVVRGRFVEPPDIPAEYIRTLCAAVGGSPRDRAERLLVMEVWTRVMPTTVTQRCSKRPCPLPTAVSRRRRRRRHTLLTRPHSMRLFTGVDAPRGRPRMPDAPVPPRVPRRQPRPLHARPRPHLHKVHAFRKRLDGGGARPLPTL